MLPQSVLIGLVVAVVGYLLQQRAWRHSRQEEIRQRDTDACLKLVDELSRSLDKRLVAIEFFYTTVDDENVSCEEFAAYKTSVRDWMHEFSYFKSNIYHYYGRQQMLAFENELHRNIQQASDICLRTHKYGKKALSTRDLREHQNVRMRLGFTRYLASKFLKELNERISAEDIGRTKMFDNIDVGNLESISRSYLIQRLFGLKS